MELLNQIGDFLGRGIGGKRSEPTTVCHTLSPSPFGAIQSVSSTQAMKLSAVYACVDVISNDVAKLPLEPYRVDEAGRKIKALDDPTYELLCFEPSPHHTRYTLMQALVASMLLRGEGFARIYRQADGTAREIRFVNAQSVAVLFDRNTDEIDSYYLSGTDEFVTPEDMIHLLNFSYDGKRGVSTLQHAGRTLGIATASEEHAGSFFNSGGAIRGIIKVDNIKVKEEEKARIRQEWANNFVNNSSQVAILGGSATFTPISISPKDAQLLESRQFNLPEICRFFRVSPIKIGDLSNTSYSSIEATNLAHLTDTISSYLEKIEQEFRRKIYPKAVRGRMRIEFDTSLFIRGDIASTTDMLARMIPSGVMTINEARARLNMPPVEDGDEPLMMVNITTLKKAQTESQNTPTNHKQEHDG